LALLATGLLWPGHAAAVGMLQADMSIGNLTIVPSGGLVAPAGNWAVSAEAGGMDASAPWQGVQDLDPDNNREAAVELTDSYVYNYIVSAAAQGVASGPAGTETVSASLSMDVGESETAAESSASAEMHQGLAIIGAAGPVDLSVGFDYMFGITADADAYLGLVSAYVYVLDVTGATVGSVGFEQVQVTGDGLQDSGMHNGSVSLMYNTEYTLQTVVYAYGYVQDRQGGEPLPDSGNALSLLLLALGSLSLCRHRASLRQQVVEMS